MPKPLEPMWTDAELVKFDREWARLGLAIKLLMGLAALCFVSAVIHG